MANLPVLRTSSFFLPPFCIKFCVHDTSTSWPASSWHARFGGSEKLEGWRMRGCGHGNPTCKQEALAGSLSEPTFWPDSPEGGWERWVKGTTVVEILQPGECVWVEGPEKRGFWGRDLTEAGRGGEGEEGKRAHNRWSAPVWNLQAASAILDRGPTGICMMQS